MDNEKTLRKIEVKQNQVAKVGAKPMPKHYDDFQEYLNALAQFQCVKVKVYK